ncbi:hypothetical protein, partial [uncultured Microscilla sp.]|uniref:hypothetical protein n=1 Tax=uncultured Microscilla sp. TaxID=432653 RepID=UPI00261ECC9F
MKFLRFTLLMAGLCVLSFFMEVKGQKTGLIWNDGSLVLLQLWLLGYSFYISIQKDMSQKK